MSAAEGPASRRIVIIEDSEIVRTRIQHLLEGVPGIEVVGYADDVEPAVGLIQAVRPDAVVLDLSLRSGSGMRVLQRVKQHRPDLVVVVLTNHALPEYRTEAMALGASAFLDKAREFDRVADALRQPAPGRTGPDRLLDGSEQLFTALADATTDAIIVSEDGLILEVNEGFVRLFGYGHGELVGRPVVELLPGELRALAHERVQREADEPFEAAVIAKDGRRVEVLISARMAVRHGRRLRLTALRDVTTQRRLERQLREMERIEALGRLAGAVAHDFNNLLTVINTLNGVGLMELAGDDPRRADLEEIAATVERGQRLARQLQVFGADTGDDCRAVPLAATIAAAEPLLSTALGSQVALRLRLLSNGSHVCLRGGTLDQLLLNLAVNARDAMPEGGTLDIGVDVVERDDDADGLPAGPYARLVVADTGAGMDDVTRGRIFEPFFTTKGPGRGTGLGLATVHGIVRKSGGRISVESEIGRGTSFEILLPVTDAA